MCVCVEVCECECTPIINSYRYTGVQEAGALACRRQVHWRAGGRCTGVQEAGILACRRQVHWRAGGRCTVVQEAGARYRTDTIMSLARFLLNNLMTNLLMKKV